MTIGLFRRPFRLLAIGLLSGLLITQAPVSDARVFWHNRTADAPSVTQNPEALAQAVLSAVNQFRREHHLPPVRLDPRLNRAAQAHADYMAAHRTLTHTGANGLDPSRRVTEAGYRWRCIAENVATGQITAEEVVRDWMDSPRHRANLLQTAVTDIGVGYNDTYWTLDLAG
jgi:uncharacterized protein YkwD